MRRSAVIGFLTLLFSIGVFGQQSTQGELVGIDKSGKRLGSCPLKNTAVQAEISGFLTRVRVTQEFENTFAEKIEAIYVFPLPQNAAVDDLTMRIGDRTVRGKIMKREEAREVYEAAKSNGQVASLLDQERPNIFTQSVANILPGEKVVIEISYVETLKYEAGSYEFVFPMVVGPRYIPGNSIGKHAGGFAPDTDAVPDGSKITPKVARDRAGHDISIRVKLDAGVAIESVASKSHQIESAMLSSSAYDVKLKNEKTIPNKDFILRFDVAGKKISDAVLTHRAERGGYFTLILQPPDTIRPQDVTPKEIVFVLDTSGSMNGFPIEKAKESMKLALDGLNPQDTFNLITFAGDTAVLFDEPVPATPSNLQRARAFLESRNGSGGTEMMKAIKAALDPSDSKSHVRIVCFMTDGYVGNEAEIIAEIQKHPNARIFSFGIGSSVNRYLLDKMAEEGRGEVEYVALNDDGSAAARRFHERVRSPLLTDIELDFGGLQVADVYPKRINDLFSAKPIVIHGRFTAPGSGTIKLKGNSSGNPLVREIAVNLPEKDSAHDVLATLWARTRIDDLTSTDVTNQRADVRETITNIGLEYRLMTQFTSFVAVEERVVTDGGQPRKIEVPVELPDGVNYDSIFESEESDRPTGSLASPAQRPIENFWRRRDPASGPMRNSAKPSATPVPGLRDKRKQEATLRNLGGVGMPIVKRDAGNVDKDDSDSNTINGIKLANAPKPVYATPAKTDRIVSVEVTIDPSGKVTEAKTLLGANSLRSAAEIAAMATTVEIPEMRTDLIKITAIIDYNFTKDNTVQVAEYLRDARIDSKPNKYHSSVRALVKRVKTNGPPAAEESKFVLNGKAELVIRLSELKPEIVEQLKAAGVEILTEIGSANAVVGRVAIEKVHLIADLEAVRFISPQGR